MMSLGTWNRRSTRYQKLLNLCNVFLLITSTILIFSSVVLMSFYHITKLDFWSWHFYWCPMAMLALGLYTFFICIYGFLISTRESRGLISLMAVLIGIAFLGQVFSIFTAFELRFKITSEVLPIADENMQRYLSDETVKYNWDWMQRDLRCCGDRNYETGFQSWNSILNGDVPDSCCHNEDVGCGKGKLSRQSNRQILENLGIWKDGCLDILINKMKNDVVPMLMVYSGVGALIGLVELITMVLGFAYVAQISRRERRNKHMTDRTRPAYGNEEEYLPSLTSKETNF